MACKPKNIRTFLSENFQFLVVKFSVYLNRHVFVMTTASIRNDQCKLYILHSSHNFGNVLGRGQLCTVDTPLFNDEDIYFHSRDSSVSFVFLLKRDPNKRTRISPHWEYSKE